MTESTPSAAIPSRVRAVLFDLDGTLVDTNYLHVVAWWEAFRAEGHEVSCYDLHRTIGVPSEAFVERLLGHPDDRVVAGHDARWAALRDRVLAFHGAGDLLRACTDRGLRVVWATSGSADDIEAFQRVVGAPEAVHAVVGGDDVERGKPDPEVVEKALAAAGVGPSEAVMVGDTTYDVRAARAAGVRAIGLLAGGIGEVELREAGADLVVGNAAELLERLEEALG